jgi:hypothetical protein
MPKPQNQSCATCKYYQAPAAKNVAEKLAFHPHEEDDQQQGPCLRYPPVAMNHQFQPTITVADNWCGEWSA